MGELLKRAVPAPSSTTRYRPSRPRVKSSGVERALNSSVEDLSRDSATSSWFCRLTRRSSATNHCEISATVTGINIATPMITHSRRVSPLRRTELYGDPLI